ncbi:MAG: DNA mismatch repair protein [Clostridia bacterium]|nr:DNA mismatch repair protein [Clostridia bacterium]
MGKKLVKVSAMTDALRNTGYKSIESAMSEIIDNSIQWNASNVFVIASATRDTKMTGRKRVEEIAFLDNGTGMSTEILSGCLSYGETENYDRKGMGRFGVGLPQSSMYACTLVEVYSWQNGDHGKIEAQKVFLDINKIRSGETDEIDDPVKCEIPEKYKKYLTYKVKEAEKIKEYNFLEHGTLVIWKNCDRINPKTVNPLFKRLQFELGKRFRYFICDGSREIKLIYHENPQVTGNVMPNDPLMLMENNMVLGNPECPGEIVYPIGKKENAEPIFEPYGNEEHPDGVVKQKVKYVSPDNEEIKEGIVTIKFSKVKDKFYDRIALPTTDPGDTQIGKHVKELEGISIVRAKREIDFNKFDFYDNINSPQHRWWGCEISFEPELDEAFGVANNKQHVELKYEDYTAYEDEEVKPIWIQIQSVVSNTISEMHRKNKEKRKGTRNVGAQEDSTKYTNDVEKQYEAEGEKSETTNKKNSMNEDERKEKIKEELQKEGIEVTEENVSEYMDLHVKIIYKGLGKFGTPLFDYNNELGTCIIIINTDHIFYKSYLESVFENIDTKIAFEFFITAFVKATDVTNPGQVMQNDKLITTWNERLRKYVEKQRRYGE